VLIAEDAATREPVGYCASRDRYLKRDELGVIYQLCVAPGHQRGLIGATLIQAVFNRAAYGCRLFCCWCAQDLAANHFWEAMGFVPIAFRGGSGRKRRVHIFWQKRIDAEDVSECGGVGVSACASSHSVTPTPRHPVTPYWYPSKTDNGALREDRIVFPIPPGVHWSEVVRVEAAGAAAQAKALDAPDAAPPPRAARATRKPAPAGAAKATQRIVRRSGMLRFATAEPAKAGPQRGKRAPKAQAPKEPAKVDPALLAQARELRDRWMERANERGVFGAGAGKYLVARTIDPQESTRADAMLDAPRRMALPAA
jgi:hypothetical protein